ncbi:MAG: T9SS type A sorting domain-containing protein, partial [Bacteroidetes bacterium]|nr:T9SS type A sorting domain-containing protein [Bacteroidota bacterium]
ADWPVGINDNGNLSANLILSPNPANENVRISFNNELSKINSVEIIALDGRSMFRQEFSSSLKSPYELNISSLASGLYIVSVMTSEGLLKARLSVVK